MLKIKNEYIVITTQNKFEYLQFILLGWLRGLEMLVFSPGPGLGIPSPVPAMNILRRIPLIRKYIKNSVKECSVILDKYKGLYYEINREAIDLALEFYNQEIKGKDKSITYYNKILNTNKFEAFIKKAISNEIATLLSGLHFIRLSGLDNKKILMTKNLINKFVIKYIKDTYKTEYHIKWVVPRGRIFYLCIYYGWLFKECIKRGVVFNKNKKEYKLSKQSAWGFYWPTLRDDIIIDNNKFKMNDILLLQLDEKSGRRLKAYNEAKRRGFATASISNAKININKNIFNLLFFYIFVPLKVYIHLSSRQQLYLFYYILSFHKQSFPIEMLMNLYRIKCHISAKDYGDVAFTITLNKYGTKSTIFHWSNLATFKACGHAFVAHNVYFAWGDMHYDYHADTYFVDKKINIGCMFKKGYNEAVKNKENIVSQIVNLMPGRKIVAFFDGSFDKSSHVTDSLFLEFMKIIKEFCQIHKDINVLLKPKVGLYYKPDIIENYNLSEQFRNEAGYLQFKKIWNRLRSFNNFIYLNPPRWGVGEVIAISDVCINMALTSPSTIALICGRNALYFDNTGNEEHPFVKKYKNKIVFEDKNLLFQQIDNILKGKFNCRDIISEREIREYDTFSDDNALERWRNNLYELTS